MGNLHCNETVTPVIGILCMDIATTLQNRYGREYQSYLAASYVRFLEAAGAKVIPIWNNRPRIYYESIMNKINGILMPGGAIFFNPKFCTKDMTSHAYTSSKIIFDIARQLKHFPLWGTCLGYQLLLTHSAGVEDVRQDCKSMNVSLPVQFEDDKVLQKSKLFADLDESVKARMSSQPFGYHYHKYCITKEDLRMFKIEDQWQVLACNKDDNGLEFINIVEHKEFPFYGSQIHPERVFNENLGDQDPCHHCPSCYELNQYFAKFFAQQCRLNENRFADEDLIRYNINNYPLTFTAQEKLHWQLCYLFKADTDYPNEVTQRIEQ
ncbi:gamma-glutamyl hydrolase B-like [Musca vetustissima]|uniref:gamma-glutamyl hydrolase B-like n=1 Tax=Musca vetustissima TaxID=27455 RepID=UPI002AB6A944|nr:gamma-glutamyl hydrolase B-like [Musca vetustissima]